MSEDALQIADSAFFDVISDCERYYTYVYIIYIKFNHKKKIRVSVRNVYLSYLSIARRARESIIYDM